MDPDFRQLVSALRPGAPPLLVTALWDDPGGVALIDISTPHRPALLSKLATPELARANRTKLVGDTAWLPLEQDPGGFAAVDISDPAAPALAMLVRDIPGVSVPYTLTVYGGHLYLFGSEAPTMAVFKLP